MVAVGAVRLHAAGGRGECRRAGGDHELCRGCAAHQPAGWDGDLHRVPVQTSPCLGCIGVVATWCLAVTGLLDPAALSVIGLTGVLLGSGTTGSVVQSAGAIVVVPLAIAGLVRLTRNPDRLGAAAGHVLRWIKPAPRSARRNRLSGADEGWSRTCNRSGRPGGRGWARGCCPC